MICAQKFNICVKIDEKKVNSTYRSQHMVGFKRTAVGLDISLSSDESALQIGK